MTGLPQHPKPTARGAVVTAQDGFDLGGAVPRAHVDVEGGGIQQLDLVQRRDRHQRQPDLLGPSQQRPDRGTQVGEVDAVGGAGVVGSDGTQLSHRRQDGDLLAVVAPGLLQGRDVVPAGAALDPVLLGAALERAHEQRGWKGEGAAGQRRVGGPHLDLEGQRERLPGVRARCC